MSILNKFLSNDKGNVAVIFGVVIVPVLLGIGLAVDSTRVSNYKNKLQNAADTAALSGALALMRDGEEEMKKVGENVFVSNATLTNNVTIRDTEINSTDRGSVIVKSQGRFEPMFPQLFGVPDMNFEVTSEASLNDIAGLEISIAFDATASMDFGSRFAKTMQKVSTSLEELKNFTDQGNFWVSLVPFSDRINIGQGRTHWVNGATPSNWEGCVEPREKADGAFNWAVDDTRPSIAPFVGSVPGVNTNGRVMICPSVPITGPSHDINDITVAMGNMTAGGTGRFDSALAWSWRMLSPEWRGQWGPSNYPAEKSNDVKKKIIYVSDGYSDISLNSMTRVRDWEHNLGSHVQFQHFVELCRKIKEEGIEIYMLNVDGNPHAVPYFKQCASSPAHYYAISNVEELLLPFEHMQNNIVSELRIMR